MKALALDVPRDSRDSLPFLCIAAAALALLATPVRAQSTAPTTGQSPPSGAATQAAPAQRAPITPGPANSTQSGQPAQPGIRAVNPATVRLTFYAVQPADMLVSNLIDLDVHNLQNEASDLPDHGKADRT